MKKMLFIVNPRSGKELMKGRLMEVLDIFCKAGYYPTVYLTQKPGDGREQAKRLGSHVNLVVCSGGDGTLNSVVSGLMEGKKMPKLGYIPAGSTNDFARSMKIPSDIKKAAELAVTGIPKTLDIGRFGSSQYFVYIAAFGAFTEVSYKTSQGTKNILGHQAYMLECVKHLSSLKSHKMKVEWDGNELEEEFIFGMVTNSVSVAGFKGLVTQDVVMDDGLFEVLLIRAPRTPVDFSNIISYMFLKEEENDYVFKFKTDKLKVTSEEPVDWVLDGEFGGSITETEIENVFRAVSLNAGKPKKEAAESRKKIVEKCN